MPLPRRFYLRPARAVARDLLGCVVVSRRGRALTAGRIVETEAYLGPEDAASHAAFRPGSHWLLYGEGGFAYVYLNYGIHHCLNAIAGAAGRPGCVLDPRAGAGRRARDDGAAAGGRRRLDADSPADLAISRGLSASRRATTGPTSLAAASRSNLRIVRATSASRPAPASGSPAPWTSASASGSTAAPSPPAELQSRSYPHRAGRVPAVITRRRRARRGSRGT